MGGDFGQVFRRENNRYHQNSYGLRWLRWGGDVAKCWDEIEKNVMMRLTYCRSFVWL